ncbi:enoyl-CoA delta isomerase 2 [Spatholobus suberectus]|nr:enoyl-CoA delta isomerase 2 [Spatholobus suberectus]
MALVLPLSDYIRALMTLHNVLLGGEKIAAAEAMKMGIMDLAHDSAESTVEAAVFVESGLDCVEYANLVSKVEYADLEKGMEKEKGRREKEREGQLEFVSGSGTQRFNSVFNLEELLLEQERVGVNQEKRE